MIKTHEQSIIARHWFLALAPVVIASNVLVVSSGPIDQVVELGVMFDLIVLTPALYLVCYRSRIRRPCIRALGLACLGVWAATKLIPEADRVALVYLEPLRYVGLAVLVLLELAVIRMIYQSLSTGDAANTVARKLVADSDTPEWVARLLVWEARLWRTLFAFLRRLVGRGHDDV